MREVVFFIGRWGTNIALACLAIATSVKPEDAMSNISGWASKFNLPDPAWLQSHAADSFIFWGAIVSLAILAIGPQVWRHRRVFIYWRLSSPPELTETERLAKLAADAKFSEVLDAGLREGLKSVDITVEEAIRPSVKVKFLRYRQSCEFFARPPFSFYKAKRRLEFIDAWKWFFYQHNKVIISDLSTDRNLHKTRVTAALIHAVNQAPREIYHLSLLPDDVKAEVETQILKEPPKPPSEEAICAPARRTRGRLQPSMPKKSEPT